LMLSTEPNHTIKINTTVNTFQKILISITLICVKIQTNLAQTKHKKKNKLKLVLSYEKILTKPKKFVRHKIVTNKFGGAQTKTYYTQ
jgi:hypothetical protein